MDRLVEVGTAPPEHTGHRIMARTRAPDPVLLIVAAFSRHEEARHWARQRLDDAFGPVAPLSFSYDFNQTDYYAATMGPELKKDLIVFTNLVLPDCLPDTKIRTNRLEAELAESGRFSEARPLNLDPGILSLGKFQLATTKDQAHRIYLRDGIFAENTLRFQADRFEPWPWTYADYRQPDLLDFLGEARQLYRQLLESHRGERKQGNA